jgi:type II secretory ATPase GspE/PulE/Tfp pilus assembly ATPase PilB-like protein
MGTEVVEDFADVSAEHDVAVVSASPVNADQAKPKSDSRLHVFRADPRLLGQIISQYTSISPSEIEAAVERARETGLPIGEQLIRDGKLTEEDRARCLALQWGLPFCDLRHARVSRSACKLLESDYQRQHKILLLQLKDGLLYVGLADPLKVDVLDEVRLITGWAVKPIMVSETALAEQYAALFDREEIEEKKPEQEVVDTHDQPIDELLEVVKTELNLVTSPGSASAEDDIHALDRQVNEAAVIRLVNSVLREGIDCRASDIHLQAHTDRLQVRYRVDGVLQDGPKVPRELMRVVIARMKVMANLDLAVRRTPQDGRITLRAGDRNFEARVSILPSARGATVVLRLAEQNNSLIGLDRLGFAPKVLQQLRSAVQRPHGMILITGPTGSGKSTTLYSALSELNSRDSHILTVEDPVESQIDGVTQAEISERAGLSFAVGLRAALRQDPDIIMVGEIRDTETAVIATQASLTGHLVLSTLHTNDAPSAVTRIVDMGIQPFLVGSSLIAVLAQRLVRKLCPECSESFVPDERELRGLDFEFPRDGSMAMKRPVGCPTCHNGGYKGRLGIFELLTVTESIRDLILDKKPDAVIRRRAIEEGMATLKDDVCLKLIDGRTSLEEAHRTVFFGE